MPKKLAGAEQFANERHNQQHKTVAQAVADAVEKAGQGRILEGKRFGTSQDNAVGDDQTHINRELFADVERICL